MRGVAVASGLVLLVSACGALEITLGEGVLPPIDLERAYDLGDVPLAGCPAGEHTITDQRTGQPRTVVVTPVEGGCQLAFEEEGLLLFDEAEARETSEALRGRTIQGVRSAAVIVTAFFLGDAAGVQVDLQSEVQDVEIAVDGQVLFDLADLRTLPGEVRKELSGPLLDKLIAGVNESQPVRADVTARIEVPEAGVQDLPPILYLETRLQPELVLDVAETLEGAAGG